MTEGDHIPTEAVVKIEMETGGTPQVVAGGIAASGYYHITLVSGPEPDALVNELEESDD